MYPFQEFTDSQLLRSHAFDGCKEAVEDVVEAAELAGSFDGEEVRHLGDDAEHGVVATLISADRAVNSVAQHAALPASANAIAYRRELLDQRRNLLPRLPKEGEGVPLGRLRSHSWESPKAVDELLDGFWVAHAS